MSADGKRDPTPEQGVRKDTKDLVRGAAVNYLGTLAKASKFLFVLVAARVYGVNELGLYFLAWAAVDLSSKFGLWGMDRSMVRDITRYYVDDSAQTRSMVFAIIRFHVSLTLGLGLLVAAVLFGLAGPIATTVFQSPDLALPLRILALSIPFIVVTQTLIAATKALRIMRYDVLIRLTLEPLMMLLAVLALIPLDLGATGLVSAHLFGVAVGTAAALLATVRTYRGLGWHDTPLPREVKAEAIRFTSPMAVMDFVTQAATRLDIMLVGALVGAPAAGIYGIAVEIVSVIKRVRQGLEPIFAPIVSELFYSRQRARLTRSYVIVTRWLLTGALLPVLAMVLYPAPLLAIFSSEAMQAETTLVVLALAHGLYTALNASENLLVMSGKSFLNMVLGVAALLVCATACIPLIMTIGPVGAALGMLVTYAFISCVRVYSVYALYQLHPFGYSLLRPLANAVLVFVLFYTLDRFIEIDTLVRLVPALIMMTVLYLTLYFWGPKEPEEVDLLARLRTRLRGRRATAS